VKHVVVSPLRSHAPPRRVLGLQRLGLRALRLVPPLTLLILGVLLWQVFVQVRHVPDYLLPAPSAIWQTTLDERDLLLTNSLPTFEIAVFGFALALAAGLLVALAVGLLLARRRRISIAKEPDQQMEAPPAPRRYQAGGSISFSSGGAGVCGGAGGPPPPEEKLIEPPA